MEIAHPNSLLTFTIALLNLIVYDLCILVWVTLGIFIPDFNSHRSPLLLLNFTVYSVRIIYIFFRVKLWFLGLFAVFK